MKNVQQAISPNSPTTGLSLIPTALGYIDNPAVVKWGSRAFIAGTVINYIWKWWKENGTKNKFTNVSIYDDSEFYHEIIRWSATLATHKSVNQFDYIDQNAIRSDSSGACVYPFGEDEDSDPEPENIFVPQGTIVTKLFGVNVTCNLEKQDRTLDSNTNSFKFVKDKILLTFDTRDKNKIKAILEEIKKVGTLKVESPLCCVYTYRWGWRQIKKLYRKKEVVLPNNGFELLTNDLRAFLSNKEWYDNVGLKWSRSYMFSGLSGSGKSSAIQALATHFKLNVYVLSLSLLNDETLSEAVSNMPEKSILLLEDIDCAIKEDRQTDKTGVTFSGLLNALDGIAVPEGRITFMTTNHIEKLDEALLRPGRADFKMEFTFATKEQIIDLARKFKLNKEFTSQKANEWASENISMAQVQERLVKLHKEEQNGTLFVRTS